MTLRTASRCLLLITLLCVPAVRADEPKKKRPLDVHDLYHLERIRAMALSPDGKRLVYERQWVDGTGEERHSLWESKGTPEEPLQEEVADPRASVWTSDARAPFWSPDGKWLAFLSTRPRPKGWAQTPRAAPE